jgi:hypothetical protein
MTWRPIKWLLVAIGVIGLFIVVFERRLPSGRLAVLNAQPLLQVDVASVTRLSVTTPEFKVDCVARNGKWTLVRPVETRADAAGIRRILESLNRTVREEVISVERQTKRGLSLASFGLDVPRARLRVGSEQHQDEVVIGGGVPLTKQVYVMLDQSPEVVAVSRDVEGAIPASLDALRDRGVIPASFKRISRLEVKHSTGFVQLVFRGGEWRLQQPQDARADGAAVERLIGGLRRLSVESFGKESSVFDPVAYGLGRDEAVLQIAVWQEGGVDPIELTVGKAKQDTPDMVYANVSDMGAVCLLKKEFIQPLMVNAEDLRDRRLCDATPSDVVAVELRDGEKKLVMQRQAGVGWMITDPLRMRADMAAVGGLLRRVCGVQAEALTGLAASNVVAQMSTSAIWRVVLSTAPLTNAPVEGSQGVAVPGTTWSYMVAPNPESGACAVYHEESKQVFRIGMNDFPGRLPSGGAAPVADALVYMGRRVLDVDASKVRRITVSREGIEESVVRDSQGRWTADSPPEAAVSDEAVAGVLRALIDVQAERVESASVTNPAAYGLGERAARLTIGLSGAGGIQKTVVIGSEAPDGNVYASLQGQDVVYVLRKDRASSLIRKLVVGP